MSGVGEGHTCIFGAQKMVSDLLGLEAVVTCDPEMPSVKVRNQLPSFGRAAFSTAGSPLQVLLSSCWQSYKEALISPLSTQSQGTSFRSYSEWSWNPSQPGLFESKYEQISKAMTFTRFYNKPKWAITLRIREPKRKPKKASFECLEKISFK